MLISIILPTYNRGNLLGIAIKSVLDQSYSNWELIIIDNNSTDNTDDIINQYQNHKIRILKINNDGNIAKSRNEGIKNAVGSYIAFLDSDDYWHKDKLSMCIKPLIKNPGTGVCHAERWEYDNDARKNIVKEYGPDENFTYKKLLERGNCLSLSAVIIPKAFIEKVGYFDERSELITAEDYELWIRFAKENLKINFINNILGTFKVHQASESNNRERNSRAIEYIINHHVKNDIDNRKCKSSLWLNNGKQYHLNGEYSKAFKYYYKSLIDSRTFYSQIIFIISLLIPLSILRMIYYKRNS